MRTYEKSKSSMYLGEAMMDEIRREAERQDRPISWLIRQAWEIAKPTMAKFPTAPPGSCDRRRLRGRPPTRRDAAPPQVVPAGSMAMRDENGYTEELRAFFGRNY